MSETLYYENTCIFFDGKVLLRNFKGDKGRLTFGFMAIGEYRWVAEETERFEISEGEAIFSYKETIISVVSGSEVIIPQNTTFTVKVSQHLDYRCYYD
ncbi:pyrimidine/purine nucleoside phosphorylase [Xenorhabdus sp. XENO-10]|uniref:Pyrimidine/purine nucleoside phosphorylase n=1 Tax=Xenorhabdus yunnanensis TaxID=3025878 RepID=A0ABT5LHK9_9GAMM|nr:pyrimidine/purine nucleoside phosphorylase [Xenorhabdus yunnanensis]MDC9589966.1 pyrimidine/purine nucleoside phosphorylase [Xenorhabdus yunnanensis]